MSSPVWMELPVELVLLVFVEAARATLEWKASWITQLSLVSRATYNIVTPILYETLVISDKNLDLAQLVEEERLMSYVQKVCIVSAGPPYPVDSPIVRALSRETIHTLDTPTWSTAKLMTHPRYLYLHNSTLCELPTGRSRLPLASVTHLSVAYEGRHRRGEYGNGRGRNSRRRSRLLILTQPSLDSSDSDDSTGPQQRRDPLYMVLDALPALTHLSLDVGHQHTPLPGNGLRIFIFKILEACPRLHVFALHVMGEWDLVASLVAPVRDSRIRVWFDRRVPSSAGEELDCRIRDLRIGCNVWTQAEPLTDRWIDELSR
ncbi:hypothetical protein EXIGLDRAFT_719359 [Exidia glandulosa HHB12029]|uniref:F-box domain-containing protein n=1 Tax=Exidia glandulosa HHB12029 TaxID=1314781 RepID=A0A165H3C6_EXIGL|nr:hypothetical protein EXIGLDRAFT_719359 [Exidia glandulosa HHB12029]